VKWLRYGYESRLGIAKATADFGKENYVHPWVYKYLDFIYMNVVN
jgi:hypothetical protein